MEATTLQMLAIFASILTSSLVTAFFTLWYQKQMTRPKGVGQNIEATPVLSILTIDEIKVTIVLTHQQEDKQFDNLYAATIDIENLTNNDYKEFEFGVDFTGGDKAIYAACTGKDRLHKIIPRIAPEISNPLETIDFVCKPFNRRNKYIVTALITIPEGSQTTSDINIVMDDSFFPINLGTYGY